MTTDNEFPMVLEVALQDGGCWRLTFQAEDGTSVAIHLPSDFTEESVEMVRLMLSEQAYTLAGQGLAATLADVALSALEDSQERQMYERRMKSYLN